jgi:hypothetical protein
MTTYNSKKNRKARSRARSRSQYRSRNQNRNKSRKYGRRGGALTDFLKGKKWNSPSTWFSSSSSTLPSTTTTTTVSTLAPLATTPTPTPAPAPVVAGGGHHRVVGVSDSSLTNHAEHVRGLNVVKAQTWVGGRKKSRKQLIPL